MYAGTFSARSIYLFHETFGAFFFSLMVATNLIWQAEAAGLTPLQLVLVGTVLEATAFLCEVPTGIVADVYSRRLSVIIGVVIGGIGWMIEGLFPIFGFILLAQVIWGVGVTFISGAHAAWIADEVGEEQVGPIFIRASQLSMIASLAAVPLAVWLGSIMLNLPILIGAGLHFVLAIVLILFMPETGFRPAPREGRNTWQAMGSTFSAGTRLVRARPLYLTLFGIAAFYGMASEGIDRLFTPHFLDNIGFPAAPEGLKESVFWFGAMGVGGTILTLAVTEWANRRLDTTQHGVMSRSLFVINALQIISVVAFAFAGSFAFALAAWWSVGIFRRVFRPLFDAWLNQGIDPRVRATVLSMSAQSDALGQIFGGPLVGAIGSFVSLRAALATAGIILAPALALYVRALRQGSVAPPVEDVVVAST